MIMLHSLKSAKINTQKGIVILENELVFQNSSHFQHWHLYCIYFGHSSLSLPQTWLLFRHGVLLLPTCLPGLESLQALCRIK